MSLKHPTDPRPLHAQAIKTPHNQRFRLNHLITLYSKSNFPSYGPRVFHGIPTPNVVSWTALISSHPNSPLSLRHFISMLRHPTFPNQGTLATLFKTCASLPSLSFGLQLHSLSLKLSLSSEPFAASAILHFYSKCRLPDDALKAFDEIPQRDEVCYGSMIVGLTQNSRHFDALSVFADMRFHNVSTTMHSLSAALRAAAELAALEQCRIIHGHAFVAGFDREVVVGSALIDGYGKSGVVKDARRVFDDNFWDINVIGWNAMMSGYAQQGDKSMVLQLFDLMERQGFAPDEYSFLALLSAFCNANSAAEAEHWLGRMKWDYGLEPGLEHYTCLVGAMARQGRLMDAESIALALPVEPDAAVWRALLTACAYHGQPDMAWAMGKRLLELNENDDSAYVIVANAFSAAGRWEEVSKVRSLMKNRGVKKEGGRSWIEVRGSVHEFLAGDRRHPCMEAIYAKLDELMDEIGKLGYVPVWDEMHHDVNEGAKREGLRYHSEKLALAFGLMSNAAPPGKALRIVKNLRTCRDCHEAFKYIGRVVEREIIVRDVNRYHRFLDGRCSCGDMW